MIYDDDFDWFCCRCHCCLADVVVVTTGLLRALSMTVVACRWWALRRQCRPFALSNMNGALEVLDVVHPLMDVVERQYVQSRMLQRVSYVY